MRRALLSGVLLASFLAPATASTTRRGPRFSNTSVTAAIMVLATDGSSLWAEVRVQRKLGTSDRAEFVRYAIDQGLAEF